MKTLAALVFGAAILLLAFDKVRNEHAMTVMYERQAAALETIALGVQGIELQKHPEAQTMSGVLYPNKALDLPPCKHPPSVNAEPCRAIFPDPDAGLTMEQRAEKAAKLTDAQVPLKAGWWINGHMPEHPEKWRKINGMEVCTESEEACQ